jgi:hypothetical protein
MKAITKPILGAVNLHPPAEKTEHHYYLKIYRRGVWLLFFYQIQVFFCTD